MKLSEDQIKMILDALDKASNNQHFVATTIGDEALAELFKASAARYYDLAFRIRKCDGVELL